ncbi:MAG TPA: tetratricopeptide repeat protein [Candidatus Acidoferrales bacterium]|nr:tetratricopeptide repeat protein [Candidatus Acidoferrales bacterium]
MVWAFFPLALAWPAAAQTPTSPTPVDDVAPILYQHCTSCHHKGESAPFPLTSYADAKRYAPEIAQAVGARSMPPWLPEPGFGNFANDPRLTDAEIRLIEDWVKKGAPEGPAWKTLPPPQSTDGWQLGPPDLVVEASRAYTVPSSGPDIFWNFIFSPPIQTRRYVRAVEVRPGIAHGVHHANLLVDRTRSARLKEAEPGAGFPGMDVNLARSVFDFDSHFLFWKPGSQPWVEPDGLAWELDPGSDLVLNTHLMTMGMPMEVKPSIGLYFTEKPPDRFPLLIELEHDGALDIPPGARDFTVSDDFRLPLDVDVLAIYPHAHYLGHVIEGYATTPSGERKWLIRIPDWDPNWQAVYHYREPVFLPQGTVVSMRWHYDNSEANSRNPHKPPARVEGGNQSTDEMGHLWLQVLPRGRGDRRRELEEAMMRHRLEKYPRDYSARLWLGALMLSRLNPAGAVDETAEAVRIEPKQAEGHNWYGIALAAVGRLQEAIVQFRIALTIQPDYTSARYNLAKALVKSGRLDEAERDFSDVVAADPNDAEVRNDFGELLLRMGKTEDALDQFNKALAIDPSAKSARENRDLALHQLPAH